METTQSEERSSTGAYFKSILNLFKDIPFLLLVLSYGLNVGVYYAISTLLNPIIKPTFYDPIDDKGHSVSSASILQTLNVSRVFRTIFIRNWMNALVKWVHLW